MIVDQEKKLIDNSSFVLRIISLGSRHLNWAGPGVLSIGGAGVFDGIALCGLFALLLT